MTGVGIMDFAVSCRRDRGLESKPERRFRAPLTLIFH